MHIRIWNSINSNYEWIDTEKKYCYVCNCGSGLTVFASKVDCVKVTDKHFVWKTEHGKTFMTDKRLLWGVGKANNVFIKICDEPLIFCDKDKGIKSNYIEGCILY